MQGLVIRLGHGEGHPLAVGALVTGFLLAAALERLPLPIVYTWATTPENQEPVRLLRAHGFGRWAESMIAQYNAPDKQRGGVFATAAFAAEDAPTLFCLSMEDAANVVRWRQLPNLYSHFGSRGITILQSWSQGEECFGQGGMKKLWGRVDDPRLRRRRIHRRRPVPREHLRSPL